MEREELVKSARSSVSRPKRRVPEFPRSKPVSGTERVRNCERNILNAQRRWQTNEPCSEEKTSSRRNRPSTTAFNKNWLRRRRKKRIRNRKKRITKNGAKTDGKRTKHAAPSANKRRKTAKPPRKPPKSCASNNASKNAPWPMRTRCTSLSTPTSRNITSPSVPTCSSSKIIRWRDRSRSSRPNPLSASESARFSIGGALWRHATRLTKSILLSMNLLLHLVHNNIRHTCNALKGCFDSLRFASIRNLAAS